MHKTTFTPGLRAALLASLLPTVSPDASAAGWPQWRGAGAQGHAEAAGLPNSWSETKNVAWKTSIPGKGWSTPVIEGDRIWLTTAIDTPAGPADVQERLKANTGGQPLNLAAQVSLRAVCVDKNSGKLLHDIELINHKDPQWVHRLNSYASPSPVIENGKLYCHFGTYGTVRLDTATLKPDWICRELNIMHENGPGASPVLWKDFLIVHCDGSDQQYVAALDKQTGRMAWKTRRSGTMNSNPQLQKCYSTPAITEINGLPRLLSPGAGWLYCYDPANGEEIWKLEYPEYGFSIVPQPVVGHGMVYLSTSFMRPQILAIRIDSAGPPEIAWSCTKGAPNIPSPLLVGKELYFVSDAGIATCVDALDGTELWKERLGGDVSSSPIYADGKIYFLNREGVATVIEPGRTFKRIAENELDGRFMASPVAVGGALFVRTDQALYRIEES